jgi:diguanylate cyclase (GGDEF)-like protein/PAS domain S-box-containing protein
VLRDPGPRSPAASHRPWGTSLRATLPQGRALPDDLWQSRHRALTRLLLAHALLLPLWGVVNGQPVLHVLLEPTVLVLFAVAGARAAGRALASSAVAVGLVVASALVVHLGGGHTFLHFHFFFVVAALALYQDWVPYGVALGVVIVDHGVLGLLAPHEVYSDPWSHAHPLAATSVHAAYVVAIAAAQVVTWGWSQHERELAEHRAEEEARRLRESERLITELVDNAPAMVFVKDLEGRLVRVNPVFAAMHGRTEEELLGLTAADLFRRPTASHLVESDHEALQTDAAVMTEEEIAFPTGSRTMQLVKFPLHDEHGRPYAIACIGTDISRRAAAERELLHQARHDALTGLPNRSVLHDSIGDALADGSRVGLAFLDLDGFKEVNDSLGHEAGDRLLQAVADRLTGVLRPGELLTRLGGDEFVLLVTHATGPEEVVAAAERMLAALGQPVELDDRRVDVRGSCGVVTGRSDEGATAGMLLRDADTALYRAKAEGRGRVVAFQAALRERDERRRALQAALVETLRDGDGLVLHYQPVAVAETGKVLAVEALLRWQHPEEGLLLPGAFLEHAEERGMLPELDHWVVSTAMAQLAAWQRAGLDLTVSINASPASICDGSLVTWVEQACAATGASPTRLVVELTETAVIAQPAAARASLDRLRALGVRVALDDFGTGYSSLSHLRDLPVDVVKVDRSFTAGLRSPREAAIVEATTRLAGELGAVVVAEGVETPDDLERVVAAGCRLVQGWLIARPVPAEAVPGLLVARVPLPRVAEGARTADAARA